MKRWASRTACGVSCRSAEEYTVSTSGDGELAGRARIVTVVASHAAPHPGYESRRSDPTSRSTIAASSFTPDTVIVPAFWTEIDRPLSSRSLSVTRGRASPLAERMLSEPLQGPLQKPAVKNSTSSTKMGPKEGWAALLVEPAPSLDSEQPEAARTTPTRHVVIRRMMCGRS